MIRDPIGRVASAAALAAVAAVHAQELQVERLAAACFTCHGTDGRSVGGVPPALAGQSERYLLQQLKEFRDGRRPAAIMYQLSRGYTDAQLEEITTYFARVKPGPAVPAPAGR